jgi:hypothetical protein
MLKSTSFWYVTPCSLIQVYHWFRGTYYLHLPVLLVICFTYFFILKMDAVNSSKTSVNCRTTWLNFAEDSSLQSHRCENLKPQNERWFCEEGMKRKWETKYTLSEFNRKKHQERVRKIQEL